MRIHRSIVAAGGGTAASVGSRRVYGKVTRRSPFLAPPLPIVDTSKSIAFSVFNLWILFYSALERSHNAENKYVLQRPRVFALFHARQSDRDHSPCSYPDWWRCPLPQPKYTCRSSPSEEMTIFICQQGGRASERPSRSKVLYDCLIDVADHAICEVALQGARDVTALGEWAAFYVLSLTK
ncbi:hypothetical protein V8E53_009711 [Lactarius tabidus]